ncbi:uncharacterized protein LOC125045370 [Penaeus chinensis]|uniref:uncharacterized protein LOC125045370 n=1 Tax=Penaeus chinensis TaxID=139456 RepID=UPI001FB5C0FC|nr:uncharacterized protein LOC125045370 [Penaeus chinensis]
MAVYNACVISTLLYGSETWTTYARQERHLNTIQMRSIHHILGISWQDKVSNSEVLSCTGLPSMFTLLRQRRLRWLGHFHHMSDGRIPKDLLYGVLASGRRPTKRGSRFNRQETEHNCDLCKTVIPTSASGATDADAPAKQTARMLPMVNSDKRRPTPI